MALGFQGDESGHYNVTGLRTWIASYDQARTSYNEWIALVRETVNQNSFYNPLLSVVREHASRLHFLILGRHLTLHS
jgi:hypothetical protein